MTFDWLRRRPIEDVRIDLPGAVVRFNHRLKVAFLYDYDSAMPDGRYVQLEAYLNKRGYFLQIIVAAAGVPMPTPQFFGGEEE